MNTAIIKPEWSPLTIVLMVLGFIFLWPLGLAVLAYILWGEYFGGSKEKAESWINTQKAHCAARKARRGAKANGPFQAGSATGNAAFDEYREEQIKRLEEERRRLEEERAAFEEYLASKHKDRDREEFERFKRDRSGGEDERQGY